MILLRNKDAIANTHDLAGTFAGLMDLYELNYIGLRRLVPKVPEAGVCLVSQVEHALDLYLTIGDRFRYTTELNLTYRFPRGDGRVPEPDLRVRVYHDARQAEVMAVQLRHLPAFDASIQSELYARWHANRFLYKWLNYLLHQGHRFEAATDR